MSTSIRVKGLNQLISMFEGLTDELPEVNREIFQRAGQALLAELRGNLGPSKHVSTWQDYYVGSGGGYAAVRPKAKTWVDSKSNGDGNGEKKHYAVGYVTNAIENGHRQKRRFVPALGKQISDSRVGGKHFYKKTMPNADLIAMEAVQEILDEIKRRLEA